MEFGDAATSLVTLFAPTGCTLVCQSRIDVERRSVVPADVDDGDPDFFLVFRQEASALARGSSTMSATVSRSARRSE